MMCIVKNCRSKLTLPIGQEYLQKFKQLYRAFRNFKCTKCNATWTTPTRTFTKKEYNEEVEKIKKREGKLFNIKPKKNDKVLEKDKENHQGAGEDIRQRSPQRMERENPRGTELQRLHAQSNQRKG